MVQHDHPMSPFQPRATFFEMLSSRRLVFLCIGVSIFVRGCGSQGLRYNIGQKSHQCKGTESLCPIYQAGETVGWHCVDIKRSLRSCGGCVSASSNGPGSTADEGRDCLAIPFVDEVACFGGKCFIESCKKGYVVMTLEEDSCVQWKWPWV
ncbi:hypothetical protein BKA70DRAFT_752886 [Coprinopsis sp. MPI-PUGE-AT-0042]|nr:hypothetical protein BKA70DRAFT_752886 [Coprinopsis sp. MPI-PUGE-AT-0042]